jgi:cytochrome c5
VNMPRIPALKIPKAIIYLMVVSIVASWVPLAFIARARATKSEYPRIHFIQDMDIQPKYTAQDTSDVTDNGAAMRLPANGVVARGQLRNDDHLYRGFETDALLKPLLVDALVDKKPAKVKKYFTAYPVPVDAALLLRGREQFNIFCSACHGHNGYGNGLVHRRAMKLKRKTLVDVYEQKGERAPAENWSTPANLHDPRLTEAAYANGKLFDVITNGSFIDKPGGTRFYKMRGYRSQIAAKDRWAVIAYVRALQLSQAVKVAALPKDLADQLPPLTAAQKLILKGKALFKTKLCFMCHAVPNGPPTPAGDAMKATKFVGKFWGTEHEVHIGPGGPLKKVNFDEAYFIESIKKPMAKIVKGSIAGMAPLPTTDEEIKLLMGYVKSLSK